MPNSSDVIARLGSAIATVIATAHEGGYPLEIKLGTAGEAKLPHEPAAVFSVGFPDQDRIPEIEKELLRCLARAPDEAVTLTEFAAYKSVSEDMARGQLRGGGRSAYSVADDLYERFDTHRPEGLDDGTYRKVRTYRLTDRGRDFVRGL